MSYRTVSFDVPPQEILTKDSVTVAVDAVVCLVMGWTIHVEIFHFLFVFIRLGGRNLVRFIMNHFDIIQN